MIDYKVNSDGSINISKKDFKSILEDKLEILVWNNNSVKNTVEIDKLKKEIQLLESIG